MARYSFTFQSTPSSSSFPSSCSSPPLAQTSRPRRQQNLQDLSNHCQTSSLPLRPILHSDSRLHSRQRARKRGTIPMWLGCWVISLSREYSGSCARESVRLFSLPTFDPPCSDCLVDDEGTSLMPSRTFRCTPLAACRPPRGLIASQRTGYSILPSQSPSTPPDPARKSRAHRPPRSVEQIRPLRPCSTSGWSHRSWRGNGRTARTGKMEERH